ncbi:hypothetical protein [uncultured Jannaschia sp.]|uniref:hypothetical protein n=1 Tax=uncultured Jannaschia sp. TaxID=293347 RepID=UPI002637703A|nr:hypothetical protein [uncultured Jannaschia sp.]
MSRPMRIGVVGCGWVFDLYMATAGRHPGIAFTALADIDQARPNGWAWPTGCTSTPMRRR